MLGMEELRAYLNGLPVAEQEGFAKRCGTTVGYMRKLLATGDLVREKTCVAIERESGGVVTRMALRPDWREIWPELTETKPNQPPAPTHQARAAINSDDAQEAAHA